MIYVVYIKTLGAEKRICATGPFVSEQMAERWGTRVLGDYDPWTVTDLENPRKVVIEIPSI